jgi:hypothetical protein
MSQPLNRSSGGFQRKQPSLLRESRHATCWSGLSAEDLSGRRRQCMLERCREIVSKTATRPYAVPVGS